MAKIYLKYQLSIGLMLLLYGVLAYIKLFTLYTGFVRNYLADLIALPLILVFSLIIIRKVKRLSFFYLSKGMIVFVLIYTTVLFEIILPNLSNKYTSDYLDIVLYLIGTLFFHLAQERLKQDEINMTL